MKLSKPLTWDELADFYNSKTGGRRAKTLPMGYIFKWAERQKDIFHVDPKEGTIHKILEER